jgi:hypothetical protein
MFTRIGLILSLFLILGVANAGPANQVQGVWQLVDYDYGNPFKFAPGSKQLKFFTASHFTTITYDSKGITESAGGGTYTLNGTSYIEHIEFKDSPRADSIGKDQKFRIKFGADTFTQTGVLSSGQKMSETWKRIE